MKVGAVVTTCPGREDNLQLCLESLAEQNLACVVLVLDGPGCTVPTGTAPPLLDVELARAHRPGDEQPRNVGVRALPRDIEAAWFVDSDIVFRGDGASDLMAERIALGADVVAAPYDWLPSGIREFDSAVRNDPRWAMFDEERWGDPRVVSLWELNVGLGCFSGNLMWRRSAFEEIGGFWNELHHGRCEDGELGLRAVAMGNPISLERRARGQHLEHPVDVDLACRRNERDVPMLNSRHPWVQDEGLHMVKEDGTRFDQTCPRCGESVNSILYWQHVADHEAVPAT